MDKPLAHRTAAALARAPLDLYLHQARAWLDGMEELGRLQLNTTHMARKRLEELHERLQNSPTGAEAQALPVELMQFHGAVALRFAQELADIGMRNVQDAVSELADVTLQWASAWPTSDVMLPFSLVHLGIRPIDDLFGSSLNRHLMPRRAPPV